MKKRLILTLIAVFGILLLAFTGCKNQAPENESGAVTQTEASSNEAEAVGEGENRSVSHTVTLSSGSEITYTIQLDKDNKLKFYTQKSVFRASSQENYEDACKEYAEIVDSENAEGYDFRTSTFECDDAKLEAIIIREWDIEKNTEGKDLEKTLSFVKEDGTFDVEGWEAQFDVVENQ